MSAIELPKNPKGHQLEEFVAAFYQICGFFIEQNAILKEDTTEILELDIIKTDYAEKLPNIELVEVKSGGWGFPDIFKIRGWMDFLNIKRGAFVVTKNRDDFESYRKVSEKLNINIDYFSNFTEIEEDFIEQIIDRDGAEDDLMMWRYSNWVSRNLLLYLKEQKKATYKDKQGAVRLSNYLNILTDDVFYSYNVVSRLDKLYREYSNTPNITKKIANEIAGNDFDDDCSEIPKEIYKKTFFEGELNLLQCSTYIEHKARVSIMKAAVDKHLYSDAGLEEKKKVVIKIKDEIYEFGAPDYLPASFADGLEKLSSQKYFIKYPLFWQWFLWGMGGFVLEDYREQEYELMSKKTGIEVDYIDEALASYQTLFPTSNGWFTEPSKYNNFRAIKMFPVQFRGIGAYYRLNNYLDDEKTDYSKLNLSGDYTAHNLSLWHDCAYKLLDKKFK